MLHIETNTDDNHPENHVDPLIRLEERLRLYPDSYQIHEILAESYETRKNSAKAIEHYNHVVRLKPDSALAYTHLAYLHLENNSYEEAKNAYLKIIKIQPVQSYVYAHLMHISCIQEDYNAVIEYFHMFASLKNENHILLYHQFKRSFLNKSALSNAINHHENITEKNADTYRNLGFFFYLEKEFNKAIECYTRAIKLNPKNAFLYHERGCALYQITKYEDAVLNFKKAIALQPDNGGFYFSLSFTSFSIKDGADIFIPNLLLNYCLTKPTGNDRYSLEAYMKLNNHIKLHNYSKYYLFRIIKTLPAIRQIQIASECFDKNSFLGKIFWRNDGLEDSLFGCSLEHGLLKELKTHMSGLTSSISIWAFLLGPLLIERGMLIKEIFPLITAYLLGALDIPVTNNLLDEIVNRRCNVIAAKEKPENTLDEELAKLSQDETLNKILTTKIAIRRLSSMFFEEQCNLHDYLKNLITSDEESAQLKAQNIIACLNNHDYNNLAQELSISRNWFDPWTETTGTKIWNALQVLIPESFKVAVEVDSNPVQLGK